MRVNEREITAGSYTLDDSDYIIWLHAATGDIQLELPPDGINERRGKVLKLVVITSGESEVTVRSPYGTPFRIGGTYLTGGTDLTVPAKAGTEITLIKASSEWRAITNF